MHVRSVAVPSDSPAPTMPSKIDGLPGRLAVLDAAGNLMTVNADGSDEIVIAEAEPGRSEVRQPTWSPDGRRVGWVHVEVTEAGALSASIATAGGDGAGATEARTAVVPLLPLVGSHVVPDRLPRGAE